MRIARGNVSVSATIPAPVGGWNARDALASMDEKYAVRLDNFFPQPDGIQLRRGSQVYATGINGVVETLLSYKSGFITRLFASAGSNIYDITSGGVATLVSTGYSNPRWSFINIANSAGTFTWACNGADAPIYYNGLGWNATAIVGVDPTSLDFAWQYKRRIYAIQKQTLKIVYLGVDAIQGAATEFDLGPIFRLGGALVAGATWSIDTGDGPDDYCVFFTNQGEVAIYAGLNPGETDWALIGVYRIGAPIGRRFVIKAGSDLAVLCEDGVIPLSQVRTSARDVVQNLAVTNTIQKAFNDAVIQYRSNFGWQIQDYPSGTALIVNVPISTGGQAHQYVMNTITGAWCRYIGMNAACWELFENRIYFGADGEVYLADQGSSDADRNLSAVAISAYNYFGKRGQKKQWRLIRPNLIVDQEIRPSVGVSVDFNNQTPTSVPSVPVSNSAVWDQAIWDQSVWPSETRTRNLWTSVRGVGDCAAATIAVSISPPTAPPAPIAVGAKWDQAVWDVDVWPDLAPAATPASTAVSLKVISYDIVMERGGVV